MLFLICIPSNTSSFVLKWAKFIHLPLLMDTNGLALLLTLHATMHIYCTANLLDCALTTYDFTRQKWSAVTILGVVPSTTACQSYNLVSARSSERVRRAASDWIGISSITARNGKGPIWSEHTGIGQSQQSIKVVAFQAQIKVRIDQRLLNSISGVCLQATIEMNI